MNNFLLFKSQTMNSYTNVLKLFKNFNLVNKIIVISIRKNATF